MTVEVRAVAFGGAKPDEEAQALQNKLQEVKPGDEASLVELIPSVRFPGYLLAIFEKPVS